LKFWLVIENSLFVFEWEFFFLETKKPLAQHEENTTLAQVVNQQKMGVQKLSIASIVDNMASTRLYLLPQDKVISSLPRIFLAIQVPSKYYQTCIAFSISGEVAYQFF
jgi:hypothetical protein